MIEVFTMALHQSNIIINILLVPFIKFCIHYYFHGERTANSIWAWLLVLVFLPLVGFILYLLLGRQIQREHIFKLAKEDKVGLEMIVDEQLEALKSKTFLRVIIKLLNLKKWYKCYFIIMLLFNN